jgi:hypothetical protein
MNAGGAPRPKDPVHVPTPDDPAVVAARKLKLAEEEASKKGRSSTALAGDAAFSRTTLG